MKSSNRCLDLAEKCSESVAQGSTAGGGGGARPDAEDEPMDAQDDKGPAAVKEAASTFSKPPADQSTAKKPEEPKPSPAEETSATAPVGKDLIGLYHFIANVCPFWAFTSVLFHNFVIEMFFLNTTPTCFAVPDGEKSSESKPSEVAPKAPEEPPTAAPPATEGSGKVTNIFSISFFVV